jgi:UDP-N-acetyl-D-mannosaminuronic acid transferase (WecB/TagA/CpsF family)
MWRREADAAKFTTILGVKFFHGTAPEAVEQLSRGGLLVVPAAPALKDIDKNPGYRDALLNADLAITDSAFMVLVWNLIGGGKKIHRVSGLEYICHLLERRDVGKPGNAVWLMPSKESAERNLAYLKAKHGINVPAECVVLAPMYGKEISDEPLVALLERLKPQHVVIAVGGGTQERLGLYLKQQLSYLPAIHCIGAAIAFLSGDQVHIPMWADRLYLGWFFRSMDDPKRFIPRYWDARKLFGLMLKYRARLPEPRS